MPNIQKTTNTILLVSAVLVGAAAIYAEIVTNEIDEMTKKLHEDMAAMNEDPFAGLSPEAKRVLYGK